MIKIQVAPLVAIIVALVGGCGAALDLGWLSSSWRIAATVVTVLAVLYLIFWCERPDLDDNAPGKPEVVPPTADEIAEAATYVGRKYAKEAINSFVNLLLDQPTYLSRVDEEIEEIHGRTLTVRTRLQYRVNMTGPVSTLEPTSTESAAGTSTKTATAQIVGSKSGNGGSTLLVPVISARKGQLFDRLAVNGPAGERLPLLSQWEVRGLMWCAIASLFEHAATRTLRNPQQTLNTPGLTLAINHEDEAIMNDVIVNAVCHVGGAYTRPSKKRKPLWRRWLRWDCSPGKPTFVNTHLADRVRALGKINDLSFDTYWKERIQQLCTTLASNYILVAEVAKPERTNLGLAYSCHYSPETVYMGRYERARAKRGLYPCVIDVPMTRAFQADSYHFQLLAPSGQYVFAHHLENRGTRATVTQKEFKINEVQQYVRIYHEEGRSVAHAYIRRQGARQPLLEPTEPARHGRNTTAAPTVPRTPDLKSVIKLREIPPGSLGSVSILALLTALIILFFTISRAGLNGSSTVGGAPALILAIPAFAASALGRGIDTERLGRSSLVTYFSLIAVGVISFSAALLYVWSASRPAVPPSPLSFFDHSFTLSVDPTWFVLSLISLALVGFVWRERSNQTRYYLTIRRQVALDEHVRHSYSGKEE